MSEQKSAFQFSESGSQNFGNKEAEAAFCSLIDTSNQALLAAQVPRQYLGASRLGEKCERALWYEYQKVPGDKPQRFPSKILRVFDMGHDVEARMIQYIRNAGFELLTAHTDGNQFGFKTLDGRVAGHCDGVIVNGPPLPGIKYPLLWECKGLNHDSWGKTLCQGVKESKPVYYAQVQTYCAHFGLPNGCLFNAINRNTGEVLTEYIEFDQAAAVQLHRKAERVVGAGSADELQRAGRTKQDFNCKFCDYKNVCWDKKVEVAQPNWLNTASSQA